MQKSNLFALSAITMACAMAVSGMAQAAEAEQAKDEKVHQLQAVQVDEVVQKTGETVITPAELAIRANNTSTITDALRGQSFVQFDVNTRNSANGAELTAPQISIRGSRANENAYVINGLPNNNAFGGSGWENSAIAAEPQGDAQGIMINTELLDSINVLTENVSAEYGDFTGGVVDAKFRDAYLDRWHAKAWVRHTRDSWANQHWIDGIEPTDTPSATNKDPQKEFKRSTVGATLEGPLMDGKLGAMLSMQRSHSSTPVFYSAQESSRIKSTRELDNFLVRLNTDPTNDFYVSSTLIYAPYESDLHGSKTYDSHYKVGGDGLNFSLNLRANLSFGVLTTDLGWNNANVERDSEKHWMASWKPGTAWTNEHGVNAEGGMGDYEKEQNVYTLKSVLAMNPMYTGDFEHTIRLGAELQHKDVESRYSGYDNFRSAKNVGSGVVGEHSNGIISGEQAATIKWSFLAKEKNADFLSSAFFIEDLIKVERFSVRPGVRLSYDDVTNQLNIAPRFKFDADILNDGRFKFNAGYNRYYGTEVLNYAMKVNTTDKQIYNRTVTNDSVGEWRPVGTPALSKTIYKLDDLDTPYSDEFTVGFATKWMGTTFNIQGVIRDYQDQLKKRTITSPSQVWYMTNEGESSYQGITFSMDRGFDLGTWGKHSVQLGVTWSELESNSAPKTDFNASWEENFNNFPDQVYLDGKLINVDEMPASNYNSDWVITYAHDASFIENRLRANLLMRWESAADRIVDITENGDLIKSYKTIENKDLFNADLGVQYDLIKTANSTLTLNMDVMNLFDNKNLVNTSGKGSYSMGRQFFLGMSYEY